MKTFIREVRLALNRIAAIILKEFMTIFTDKGSRLIVIVPVIIQSLLFGYGATFNLERVPWALCDLSKSALSTEFVQRIEGTGIFELQSNESGVPGITRAVDRGEALVGLVIPEDFAANGRAMLITDARNSTTAGIAAGYISSIVMSLNESHGAVPPVTVVERLRYNENGITRWSIVPALVLALSMIQVLLLAGLSVAREREDGTFDMMLMTPSSSIEILIGKAVVPTLIACLQGFLIFAVGIWWFEIPFSGAFLTMGFLVFLFSISFVGLGLAISALADSVQAALVYVMLTLLPSIILSGLLTSVLAMPVWLQKITVFNPLRAAITSLRKVYFEGAGFMDILPLTWPIALAGVLGMIWAAWLFRHKIA